MTANVHVDLAGLDALAQQFAELAEQVTAGGHDLTAVGRPVLGGSIPAYDLINEVATNVSSTATWVMTCGSALRSLAQATAQAAAGYRATEQEAAARWNAMSVAFDDFDDLYGLMTGAA